MNNDKTLSWEQLVAVENEFDKARTEARNLCRRLQPRYLLHVERKLYETLAAKLKYNSFTSQDLALLYELAGKARRRRAKPRISRLDATIERRLTPAKPSSR